MIGTIEKACLYATDLTRQLLTFSKGSTLNRRLESLADVVREGVEFALHGSSMRCCFDLPGDLSPVEIDRNQIHQVINNLVINAVQATAHGGILHVEARNVAVDREHPVATLPPGKYVRLSLRDNGSGIAPEHLARIFDPYFTTKSAGSGLGLATSYSIIKKHDGLIQVESELGRGTTFLIYLPAGGRSALAANAANDAQARAHTAARTGGRVLFMDDESVLQELVGAMLEHLGYDVACAAHGEEALEHYARAQADGQPFAAVIVDLTVPGGMGGHETVRRLREMDPDGQGHRFERVFQRSDHGGIPAAWFRRRHRQAVPDGRVGRGAGESDPGLRVERGEGLAVKALLSFDARSRTRFRSG